MLQPHSKESVQDKQSWDALHDEWVHGSVITEGTETVGERQAHGCKVKQAHEHDVPSDFSAQ